MRLHADVVSRSSEAEPFALHALPPQALVSANGEVFFFDATKLLAAIGIKPGHPAPPEDLAVRRALLVSLVFALVEQIDAQCDERRALTFWSGALDVMNTAACLKRLIDQSSYPTLEAVGYTLRVQGEGRAASTLALSCLEAHAPAVAGQSRPQAATRPTIHNAFMVNRREVFTTTQRRSTGVFVRADG